MTPSSTVCQPLIPVSNSKLDSARAVGSTHTAKQGVLAVLIAMTTRRTRCDGIKLFMVQIVGL